MQVAANRVGSRARLSDCPKLRKGRQDMMKLVCSAIIGLALMVGGCEKEETYQGKPMHEWVSLLDDASYNTRYEAVAALGAMKSPKARNVLQEALDTDSRGFGVQERAYHAIHYGFTAEQEIMYLNMMLDWYAKNDDSDYFSDGDKALALSLEGTIKKHGMALKPIALKLQKIRDIWVSGMRKRGDSGQRDYDVWIKDIDAWLAKAK